MPRHPYASYQLTGTRSHQCDATAVYTMDTHRAYALLDGIGSTQEIRTWTRAAARRLVKAAARIGDPEQALRRVHAALVEESAADEDEPPAACAVVALFHANAGTLQVAWSGDARAYMVEAGSARRLTTDHNLRQALLDQGREPDQYARNQILSCLGSPWGENEVGSVTVTASGRLLLASDGAYEPIEDTGGDVGAYLETGSPSASAQVLVRAAVAAADPTATDNATVLVADLDRL